MNFDINKYLAIANSRHVLLGCLTYVTLLVEGNGLGHFITSQKKLTARIMKDAFQKLSNIRDRKIS